MLIFDRVAEISDDTDFVFDRASKEDDRDWVSVSDILVDLD